MTVVDLSVITQPVLAAHAEADAFSKQIEKLLTLKCDSESQGNMFGTFARQIADSKDAYLARREGGLAPLRLLTQWIEGLFPLDPVIMCDRVIDHLKKEAKAFYDRSREQAAALAASATTPAELQRAVEAQAPKPIGFDVVTTWEYEIVDVNAIPRDYWILILDEKRLAAEAKRLKDKLSVPGIKPKSTSGFKRSARR